MHPWPQPNQGIASWRWKWSAYQKATVLMDGTMVVLIITTSTFIIGKSSLPNHESKAWEGPRGTSLKNTLSPMGACVVSGCGCAGNSSIGSVSIAKTQSHGSLHKLLSKTLAQW